MQINKGERKMSTVKTLEKPETLEDCDLDKVVKEALDTGLIGDDSDVLIPVLDHTHSGSTCDHYHAEVV